MTIINKDITTIEKGLIFHCVNCQNVMGSGLALSLFTKWPQVKSEYHDYCDENEDIDLLGECQEVIINKDLSVINVLGQLNYGGKSGVRYADYGAIKMAFQSIQEVVAKNKLEVYFPFLFGAGLANGDSKIIHRLIEVYFPNAILVKWP